jgi:NAD+ synthase
MKKLANEISIWLKNYKKKNNLETFIVGVSGGVDSGLVSTLCAKTKEQVIVVNMPIYQKKDQLQKAQNHINWLKQNFSNVKIKNIELSETFTHFQSLFSKNNDHALANSRSRLRMATLYHLATIHKGLVVGTGNKVEDFGVGFYTKYGDGGVDLSPIADLTKTQVREMARSLGLLDEIVSAVPTDGLWDDGRSDEDQIGATYEELEWAMIYKKGKITSRQKQVLSIYKKFNSQNKHKMLPIPVFKVKKTK